MEGTTGRTRKGQVNKKLKSLLLPTGSQKPIGDFEDTEKRYKTHKGTILKDCTLGFGTHEWL